MASRSPRKGNQPPPPQPPPQQDPVTRFHNNALLTPSTLVGRLDVPSSNAQVDSSSSESDFQPPKQSGFRPTHARSMSNPFPSLFSGKKKRQDSTGRAPPGSDPDGDEGAMAGPSVRKHRRGAPAGSKDFATGNCMTCASLVKWPKELKVFKCTICTTINDLVPVDNGGRGNGDSSRRRDSGPDSPASGHRGTTPQSPVLKLETHTLLLSRPANLDSALETTRAAVPPLLH